MNSEIVETINSFLERKHILESKKCLIGFDGFIDQILHAVNIRKSHDKYKRIMTMWDFSSRVYSNGEGSTNIELVPILEKMGGNAPLLSMAAANMGCQVTCMGMLGDLVPHVVFENLQKVCKAVYTLGNPGLTDAIEFVDGKLMLGKLSSLKEMSWKRIEDEIGEEYFKVLIHESDLVGILNWTMLTEMGGIVENIIRLTPNNSDKFFFFDLADPAKRSNKDLLKAINQIKTLNVKSKCILSLNFKEATHLKKVLTKSKATIYNQISLLTLKETLSIHGIVIHAKNKVMTLMGKEYEEIDVPYCDKPKISTGAGDHFNGGFCAGLLSGIPLKSVLHIGTANAGWYIRNGQSPTFERVMQFLNDWKEGKL